MVFKFLVPSSNAPFLFKAVFVLVGLAVAALTIYTWWQRIAGGVVHLQLNQDPVPHGMAQALAFDLNRDISTKRWYCELEIKEKQRNSSNFGTLWKQEFAAQALGSRHVRSTITLPSDMPSTESSQGGTDYQVTLTLHADRLSWTFHLLTRRATGAEQAMGSATREHLGSSMPKFSEEEIVKSRKRFTRIGGALMLVLFVSQIYSMFGDFLPWSPVQKAKAALMPSVLNAQVSAEAFELRISNMLISDWSLKARLLGDAQVVNGELIVKLKSLLIRPRNDCNNQPICAVKSVRLLLAQNGEKTFSTAAQSNELMVNTDLAIQKSWQLPAEQVGAELRMKLPASVDINSMRLKLEIRSQTGATVYPENGNYLSLHQALARASGQSDPCKQLQSPQVRVTAGCMNELGLAVRTPSFFERVSNTLSAVGTQVKALGAKVGLGTTASAPEDNSTDALLISALKNEHSSLIPILISQGASANAQDPEHLGRSALGYAAVAGDLEAMRQLLAAGAKVNLQIVNDHGQTITPLTHALSGDMPLAVELLLQSGASLKIADRHGWTPMHIAAYHGANQAIPVLVKYGADVNEKTPSYRQQTAFHTALQHANAQTIRTMLDLGADLQATDNQAQNACGWAEFFKRSAEIKSWVCMATPSQAFK